MAPARAFAAGTDPDASYVFPADSHAIPAAECGAALLRACSIDIAVTLCFPANSAAGSPETAELLAAIDKLVLSGEEQRARNEELTALNGELREKLDLQRITSNDLQNVLYSTDVATLFLDPALNIRFFTPATTALFNLTAGDVGRLLTDLQSLSSDESLSGDVQAVLADRVAIDREIETTRGVWFVRRILPYLADDGKVEGVVITFTDVSERKQIKQAMEDARHEADRANMAKSRFLAAASHDLRQPLQTLVLLQGLLAKQVEGVKARQLVNRIDETLGAMSGMLNTLLDINQIEAGTVRAELSTFPVGDLLERLRDEFAYLADAKRLSLRLVPCSLTITSDPRLLEQILRNLISNAIKYTAHGKVLIGCRRRKGIVCIEIWDSGMGIDATDLQAIFEEYHQVDNPARERSRGLGLGLSIVKRLSDLLDHRIHVRSVPGKGSVFSLDLTAAPDGPGIVVIAVDIANPVRQRSANILIIEDDPEVRELLEMLISDLGHQVTMAKDGVSARALTVQAEAKPDLILSDYNLPGGMNGIETTGQLRAAIGAPVPVIILTGDISTAALRDIAAHDCVQLNKPVKPLVLARTIQRLLAK